MRPFFLLALLSVGSASLVCGQAPPATPPAAPATAPMNKEQEMEALFSEAQAAFGQGRFDVALQKIGAIHTATSNKDFEAVMYLEGAAHFNLKQWAEAIKFFEDFIKKFPQSNSLNDAKIAVGEAYLNSGSADKGIAALKEAAAVPELRDRAGLMIAYHHKKAGQPDEALSILEVVLKDLQGTPSAEQQQAILMASEIYVGKGDTDKAGQMMEKLRSGSSADESVVQLNVLSQQVGDAMLEQKRYGEALRAYQSMRRQGELVAIQKARISKIEQWQTQIAAGGRVQFMGKLLSKEEAVALLDTNKKILADIEGVKDYDASIIYRLGQCFYEMGRMYESLLAFQTIYEDFKENKDRDRCLFGMIVCNAGLQRAGRAYLLCEKYMNEFPEGANIGQVTDMFGSLAFESGNIEAAIKAFERAKLAKDADKERLNYLLGVVLFESQRFDDCRLAFQELISLNKTSAYKDEAEYRIALSYFFQNDSQKTRKALREYIAGNAKGQYLVDAKYRLAFIDFQGGDKGDAMEQLEKLVVEAPNDQNVGQVWSLLGDIYSQMVDESGKIDYTAKCLEAYRNAVDKAKTEDVLNYAIDAATNLMVDKNMWKELAQMWSSYYQANKDKPSALKAIYWITRGVEREAKALESEGKPDKAKEKLDEGRKLVAGAMAPHLGNPANEQVEVLIQQLVTMMVPKKRPRAAAPATKPAAVTPADATKKEGEAATPAMAADASKATDTAAAATPAPAPGPTFEEVETEFKKLMTPQGDESLLNGTAAARILYGRALIARGFRDVAKYENLMSIIPDAAKIEELSPLLLAGLGEMLTKKGDTEKAAACFQQLRAKYPNSEFGDKAPVGLGDIEFNNKEYQKALDLYNEAIEKYASSSSILEATLGKAKALLALKKYDEAEKVFTTIQATKEWRGAHPAALLGLGEAAEAKKDLKKAVSFYQRIILAYRRDKAVLAQAYLRAAKCFIELNDKESARTVLQQMLAQKDITEFPEFNEGKALLSKTSN
ncbi:tetratricopeptide repeat protein [Verrucomicrobium sp. BvORR034]|uniref:tetratricopeptide repeat protein n=1 Tax=Verrucomicrobium sp. BvORR034 TaxID=1396418 RepID=UPI002240FFDC|nr:tetratricopeptide repeat protein [Verrucomicrobium sp. BvORR034]